MIQLIEILSVVAMAPPGGGSGEGGIMGSFWFPLVMIAVLFYFILYMPEQKRKKQREAMLANMERGDEIITAGGVYGKITALTDTVATVEIAPNTRIRVSRQHVSPAGTPDNGAGSKEPDKDKNKDKNKGKGKKKYK